MLKNGASPLHEASSNGHVSTVQHLLSNGADINLCHKFKTSPLREASYDNTVQVLLSNDAELNLCDKNGSRPLHAAMISLYNFC